MWLVGGYITFNKNVIITTNDIPQNEKIKVSIVKNKKDYQNSYLDGKDALPSICYLKRNKAITLKNQINFRDIQTMNESSSNQYFTTKKIENMNFGSYTIQAIYINMGDSVYSNPVVINYNNN